MSLNPLKSTTTKWSTRTFDIFSNCAMVQASPPTAKASFHWIVGSAGIRSPLVFLQDGRDTMRSRGTLTPYARVRSADRWSRIVVSDKPGVEPRTSVCPARESEPMMRTLSGLSGPPVSTALGRGWVIWSKASDTEMLPSRCR